jgi:hypothetical protein
MEAGMVTGQRELTTSEKAALAREVAADGYEPPTVLDVVDIARVPREAFQAGWDAATAYLRDTGGSNSDERNSKEDLTIAAVLGKPTRWRDFVDGLRVEGT